jgi:hypothetical protein
MAVTNNAGNPFERYRYADYGSRKIFNAQGQQLNKSAIGNPYMFRGKNYDQETGLYSIYFDRSLNLTLDTTVWTKSFDPQSGRFIQRHGGDALGNHYTAFGNNPGRGQALSISDWDTWFELNRPSSPGYVDKACTPFAAGGPKLDFAINGNSHGTYEMAQSGSLFSGIARGILIGAEGGSPFADTGLDILISPGIASFDDDSEKVWWGIMAAGGTSQTSHFDQAQQTIAKLIRGQSPISSYDTSGDAINAIIREQSPISSITIRANRLTILGLSTLAELDPDSDVTLLLTTGGQSLSGSRGDDVWLFGGGTGILGPRINSYWQGLGLLRPKPESFVGAFGDADNIWWGWDDVWLFGGGADIDIGGFYFHPVLNFTDFILGDGF